MKNLMMTSAFTAMLIAGGAAAQTTPTPMTPAAPMEAEEAMTTEQTTQWSEEATGAEVEGETAAHSMSVPGFLASDFMGMPIYAFNPESMSAENTAAPDSRWTSGESLEAMRDDWEDIGSVSDAVLSQDGRVRGVLLDIGGFLGMGNKTVMVDINDIYFVPDSQTAEDISDFNAVAGLSREQLEALPEWNEESLVAGYPWGDTPSQENWEQHSDLAVENHPPVAGHTMEGDMTHAQTGDLVSVQDASEPGAMPTADELMGTAILDQSGENIGSVADVMLDQEQVSGVAIDVGGFLGIGTRTVMIPFENLTIVRNIDTDEIDQVQTTFTREQLESLPEYR